MKLGFIIDDVGAVRNHRSLLKVVLNPILRCFGKTIVTDLLSDLTGRTYVMSWKRPSLGLFAHYRESFLYEMPTGWSVVKKRMIW